MAKENQVRKYDLHDVIAMANPDASWECKSSPDGLEFQWEWDGKNHSISVASQDCTDEHLLWKLFEASRHMSKM